MQLVTQIHSPHIVCTIWLSFRAWYFSLLFASFYFILCYLSRPQIQIVEGSRTLCLSYYMTALTPSCCNLCDLPTFQESQGSSGSIVSDYGPDDRVRSPTGAEDFFLAPASRTALGPTQPPIQWLPGVLYPGVKRGRGVMLTTHPHLVPRLSMNSSYTSSPPMCLHGI
jgi:hypothetical protein